jgi:hypothetical protein
MFYMKAIPFCTVDNPAKLNNRSTGPDDAIVLP